VGPEGFDFCEPIPFFPRTVLGLFGSNSGSALKKFSHCFGFRLAVIAALALFVAQLGAMNHAYSHVPGANAPTTSHPTPGSHDVCDDCLNFAPLLSASGAGTALPLVPPPGRAMASRAVAISRVHLYPRPAFRSRAPPVTP
jgi:hypothetical protein